MFFRSPHVEAVITRICRWHLPFALGLSLLGGSAGAADPIPLRVKVFPGAQNLPIYAAVLLNVPWSILAVRNGMKSLGRTIDLLGPYQATGAYVMRAWAQTNSLALERYLAAYVESLRWAVQPSNRGASVALLAKWLKLAPDVAEQSYDLLREPQFGLSTDARFDLDGFKFLLALRAEIDGQWGGTPPSPER